MTGADPTYPTYPVDSAYPGDSADRQPLTGPCVRVFELVRHEDVTGFSGVGVVADGVEFPDGSVAFRWRGPYVSTVLFEAGIDDVVRVHGHNGSTEVRWAGVVPVTPFKEWQFRDEPHQPVPTPDPSYPHGEPVHPVDAVWPPPDPTS